MSDELQMMILNQWLQKGFILVKFTDIVLNFGAI